MPDHLWPEPERQKSTFAHLFDPIAPDEGLSAGFGLYHEIHSGTGPGADTTFRVVGSRMLPSFPHVEARHFLEACAPAEWEKLARQLHRPDPVTGSIPILVEILQVSLDPAREKEILARLGLTVEEARIRCQALGPG